MEAMQQTLNLVVQILHKQQQQADRRMALDKQMMKQQELTTQNVVHLRILKMMAEDDLETFLESFEWTVMAVGTDKSRQKIQVTVKGVTRGMPVGIALDLPYQMILGWDWPEIYKILEDKEARETGARG
ncbi:hypothetical protein Y1Q_0021558 [Alligator mississippiensis]|uniref:Uncharacterized protein n=1 Tax=Alligator mississippiensis TaxID=8496 RepID=A0A151PAJ3_ALLMI|nr:hypothetical protein Y1Q_0021558 [Alligator mississippiensis]